MNTTAVLERFRAPLEKALAYGGTLTLDDVVDGVGSGAFQVWPGEHSVLVTEIVKCLDGNEVNFFLAGGDSGFALKELKQLQPIVLDWARSLGCRRATFVGRPGWERTFVTKEDGWRATMRVFERTL